MEVQATARERLRADLARRRKQARRQRAAEARTPVWSRRRGQAQQRRIAEAVESATGSPAPRLRLTRPVVVPPAILARLAAEPAPAWAVFTEPLAVDPPPLESAEQQGPVSWRGPTSTPAKACQTGATSRALAA
ncbi:MAG: hypothetical protein R2737_11925 [Candidatus Nanopelagicales bacterium]